MVRPRSAWVTAGAAFVLCWFTLLGLDLFSRGQQVRPDLSRIDPLLVGCSGVAAILLGALMVVQCRVADCRRSDFGMGLGIVLYGGVLLFAGGLYPLVPPIDPASSTTAGGAAAQWALAAAWFVIVLLLVRRRPFSGARRPRQFAVAIAALGFAQAHVAIALSLGAATLWILGSHLFQLIGFAVALPMMALEFEQRVVGNRHQLFTSLIAAKVDSARHRAHRSIDAAHDHELRSTLLLLDGSVRMLVDRLDDLSGADRATFGRLIGGSVERLGVLLNEQPEEGHDCDLHDVVHSVVCGERSCGVVVTFDIRPGLRCSGRSADVAGALHTLIRSTWIHCQPAAVHVMGWSDAETVVLWIGPGELTDESAIVLPRWVDRSGGDEPVGPAVDLQVATQLLNDDRGSIWTATDPAGQTSFEVRLPAAQSDWRELAGVR